MLRIEVTSRFLKDGSLAPVEFILNDEQILIKDIGRQWDSSLGKNILVMDFQNQTYHLLFKLEDLSWYLVRDIKRKPDLA
jgi:hypothetical protein